MYLFFFGPNDYLIHRQVKKIKDRYKEKAGGDLNLTTLEGETIGEGEFSRQTLAVPLLSSSRLVIVKNIFKNKKREVLDQVKNTLDKIPDSTVVVFTDSGKVDKRLGLYKALNKPKTSKFFDDLPANKLREFIKSEVKERDGRISSAAEALLSQFIPRDLWRMSNEIGKLTSFAKGREIGADDVENLVISSVEGNVFSLIEYMATGKTDRALAELDALLELGEPPLRILSLINYQYRTVAQVKEASEQTSNQFAISKKAGLAPFQVGKTLTLARNLSWDQLASIYDKMSEIDVSIKTGRINGSEGLKELVLNIRSATINSKS